MPPLQPGCTTGLEGCAFKAARNVTENRSRLTAAISKSHLRNRAAEDLRSNAHAVPSPPVLGSSCLDLHWWHLRRYVCDCRGIDETKQLSTSRSGGGTSKMLLLLFSIPALDFETGTLPLPIRTEDAVKIRMLHLEVSLETIYF